MPACKGLAPPGGLSKISAEASAEVDSPRRLLFNNSTSDYKFNSLGLGLRFFIHEDLALSAVSSVGYASSAVTLRFGPLRARILVSPKRAD